MVVGYRVAGFTAFLLRQLGLLKINNVSLPNLLCGEALVPELLQQDCTPERITAAVNPLLTSTAAQLAQTQRFDAVRLELKRDAGALAASAIADLLATYQPVKTA
jgi:lipid-A-disaccharide synthase